MADVNKVLEGIKDDILALVTKEAKEYLAEARQDAEAVAQALGEDLREWVSQLAKGDVSKGDF